MKNIGSVKIPYGNVSINVGRYPKGEAIFVQLICLESEDVGEPYTTFSTNPKSYGCHLAPNEFNVKNWGENEGLSEPLLAAGLFEDTGRIFPSGFVQSPIWRIKDPANVPPMSGPASTEDNTTQGQGR